MSSPPSSGSSCRTAVLVLCSPLILALALVVLAFTIVWGVLGLLLTDALWSTLLGVATLAGLAVADSAAAGSVGAYSSTAIDVAVIAGTLALIHLVAQRVRLSLPTRVWIDIGALVVVAMYAVVKGSLRHSSSRLAGTSLALVLTSVSLSLLQLLETCKVWRWASPEACAAAEKRILDVIVRTPYVQSTVAGMHTISFDRHPDAGDDAVDPRPVLVMCHGYLSGSAMYMFNFDAFTPHYRVLAVDWSGCAASERPDFTPRTTAEAEDFFVGALENWRQQQGLQTFALMGHSLGGYLAAHYAMRYPSRISHLILVSPAGMSVRSNGGPQSQLGRTTPGSPTPRPIPSWLWGAVSYAWEQNFTPGVLVRFLGPLAPMLAARGIRGRASRWVLKHSLDPVLDALGDYFFHNIASDGSGEFALNRIFEPGAYAKIPVAPQLVRAVQRSMEDPQRLHCPVLMTYGGSHDWMSAPAGEAVCAALRDAGVRARMALIPESGHHCYLENPDAFNTEVLDVLEVSGKAAAATVSDVRASLPSAARTATPDSTRERLREGVNDVAAMAVMTPVAERS